MITVHRSCRKSAAPVLSWRRMEHALDPVPAAEESFATGEDGTRIHWSAVGRGEPALVLCDGIGCDGFAWKYVVRDFASSHRIVRWHYRGHGKSEIPKDRSRVGFDDICGDLKAVLQGAGVRQAVLMGHSMGVQVALEYHRRHPRDVLGLVLICGSHGLPLDTFHDSTVLKRVFPALLAAAGRWPEAMQLIWRLAVPSEFAYQVATHVEVNGKLVHRPDFEPYFRHLASMDVRVFLGMLKQASEHTAYDHLAQIDVPTLVVAGTEDTFTPYWLSEEMHDRIPDADMLTVPGGTHVAPIEHPELIALRLDKWLHGLPQSTAQLRARKPAQR
jgi:pimeloyl-ACP methyl ester carboxylesterase